MAHLITSHQGEDHISSANHAHENAGQIGNGQYAFKGRGNFALSMPNPNTLRIMSGDAQCNGYHWEIPGDYEEVTIENGTPGKKRIDLVVADIITAPKPDCKLLVLKGEEVNDNAGDPVMPSHIEGDLNDGDTHVQMPICSVKLNGTNHEEPVMLMNVLMPYAEFRDSQSPRCLARGESTSYTATEVDLSGIRLLALVTKTNIAGRWLATTVLPVSEFIKHNSEALAMNAKYAEGGSYLAAAYYKDGKAYLKHESMYDYAELWKLM